MKELGQDLASTSRMIREAFNVRFQLRSNFDSEAVSGGYMFVESVFIGHPTLGNSVIVDKNGELWQVEHMIDEGEKVLFVPPEKWRRVVQTYVPLSIQTPSNPQLDSNAAPNPGTANDPGVIITDPGKSNYFGDDPGTISAELGESSSGTVLGILEEESKDGPLQLNIAVIEPGWGNKRDNNYYPEAVVKRDAKVFEGAKMYATDHRQSEKSVLTEVSQILECPVDFTESGAPIARVGVFSETFADSIRNREALGVLGDLHCSIMGGGKVEKGYEANGRKGRKVTAITQADSVDWVTRHGAGGRALSIAEGAEALMEADMNKHEDIVDAEAEETSENVEETALIEDADSETTTDGQDAQTETPDTQEPEGSEDEGEAEAEDEAEAVEGELLESEEVFLSEADVTEIVGEVKTLPDPTRQRLLEGEYHNRYEVIAAIESEQSYLKMITGSGKPPKMGEGNAAGSTELAEEEVSAKKSEINSKYLPGIRS